MNPDMESFFNVFEYAFLMHDAIDQGLVYDGVCYHQRHHHCLRHPTT